MNRTIFISTLALIAFVTLLASMPSKFYQSDDKTFVITTIAVSAITLIALAVISIHI